MKTFALIQNDRVSNVIISNTTPSNVTSVETIGTQVSKGYGYTSSTFYEPVDIALNSAELEISSSNNIHLLLNRSLSSTLNTSSFTCDDKITVSNFVHDNVNNTITFTATTSSTAMVKENALFKWNGNVTDTFGWEWKLSTLDFNIL
tara:strand:+ start:835 stop:1275 length:441 start_codon:yes stop_codon:yes gene_type:complete